LDHGGHNAASCQEGSLDELYPAPLPDSHTIKTYRPAAYSHLARNLSLLAMSIPLIASC
jgi:hypothetical protein